MNDLEQRVEKLEKDVAFLSRQLECMQGARFTKPADVSSGTVPGKRVIRVANGQVTQIEADGSRQTIVSKTGTEKKKYRTAEQFIGKTAMGIGASVLIFIAMIMFATLIIPVLTEEMKMLAMYLLSVALIAGGELVYKKSRTGYTVLSACGVGALFISFVATFVYFHLIGPIGLYVLLLLWVFGVVFHLARHRNTLFVVVGQIGIFVATFLSVYSDKTAGDWYLMVLFLVASEFIFFVGFFRKDFWIDSSNVCGLIGSFVLLAVIAGINDPGIGPMVVITMGCVLSMAGSLLYMYTRKLTKQEGFLVRTGGLATCFWFIVVMSLFSNVTGVSQDGLTLVSVLYIVLVMLAGDWFGGQKYLPATRYLHAFLCMIQILSLPDLSKGIAVLLLMGLSFAVGLKKKDRSWYFMLPIVYALFVNLLPAVLFGEFLLSSVSVWCSVFSLLGLVLLVGQIVAVGRLDGEFFPYETLAYFVLMFGIVRCFDGVWSFACRNLSDGTMYFVLWSTFVLVMVQLVIKRFRWCSASPIPFYLMNAWLMLMTLVSCRLYIGDGISLLFSSHIGGNGTLFTAVFAVVTAVIVFSINVRDLLDRFSLAGAYIGLKYSVLLCVILRAADVEDYVMSIVFLLVAAVSVLAGFGFCNKSLRLYGLILAMIAIAKLILVDITYENSLMRAFSFLICGFICFAVSIVYNRMERKVLQEESNQTSETDES